MAQPAALSVVIPTLNEADNLPTLLDDLRRQRDLALDVVVVDGGSRDGTAQVVTRTPARLLKSAPGRARQMNRGAVAAHYSLLLFLHADSRLSDPRMLRRALEHWNDRTREYACQRIAGHFPLQFRRPAGWHNLAFRFLQAKSASNRPQTVNGDQGFLIHRDFFRELKGFDQRLPCMEDQQMAAAVFEAGDWTLLPDPLQTSARRFATEGFRRRYLLMGMMMAFYWNGCPEFLERAGQVYPSQAESRRLRLWPYFQSVYRLLLRDLPPGRALRLCYRLGQYNRANLWQGFLLVDVLCSFPTRQRRLFLRFHDRWLAPWLANPLVDGVSTLAVITLYLGILGPAVAVLEHCRGNKPDARPDNANATAADPTERQLSTSFLSKRKDK